MTVHNTTGVPEPRKGAFSYCLNEAFLQPARPVAEKFTEFRPIPEVGQDGNPLPMIRMMTPSGPDMTNFPVESIIMNSGLDTKFSGLSRASDVEADRDYNKVFPRIFIALRSAQIKNAIPPHLTEKVAALFKQDEKQRTLMNRPTDFGLMQGIAIVLNGETLAAPKSHQCFFLGATAKAAVVRLCEDSYKEGIDLFDGKTGYTIILKGRPPNAAEGRLIWSTIAERGRPLPVNPTKFWVPWSHGLKVHTFADMLKMAVRCYGADIVKFCWSKEYDEIIVGNAAPVVVHTRPAAAPAPKPDTSINLDNAVGVTTPAVSEPDLEEDIISSATRPAAAAAPAVAPAATAAPRPPAAPAAAVAPATPTAAPKDPGSPPSPEVLAKAFEGLL